MLFGWLENKDQPVFLMVVKGEPCLYTNVRAHTCQIYQNNIG